MSFLPYTRYVGITEAKDLLAVPFVVTIGANAQGGQAIGIPYTPYTVKGASIYFPNNAVDNILVYFLYGSNNDISTTAISTGANLFSPPSGTPYFIGHASAIHVGCRITPEAPNTFLKMHIVNNNAYAITIMGILYIEVER